MTISNIGNIIATETVLNNSSEVRPDWFEDGVRFSRGLIFIAAQWRRRDGETIAANEIKTSSTVYANYRHFLELPLNKSLSHYHGARQPGGSY